MKKTLVAIAALTSVSAFAQVTITGNLDFAGARFGGTMNGNKGTTITTGHGTSSTSAINITATEDIGGGTKVTAFYGIDPRTFSNDSYSVANNIPSAATIPAGTVTTGLARHEAYVQASGGFGSLKIGAPNAPGLDANGIGQPLGTGVGSGFGGASSNTLMSRSINARYSRSVRYDTPVMNGFSGHFVFAPGGDQAAVVSGLTAYAALHYPNARRATESALRYSNGPLNAMVVNIRGAAMTNSTGYLSLGTDAATTTSVASTNYNLVAANYKLGDTTIYASMGNGGSINVPKAATALASDKSTRYGVKHTMGPIDLMVAYTKVVTSAVGSTTTTNTNATGFRGDYNLSKTSAVYLGYEKYDSGSASTATSVSNGIRNITSVGLRKSF